MTSPLVAALGEEIARTLSAITAASATVSPADRAVSGDAWVATVTTDVVARGSWTIIIDGPGAEGVTAAIMGLERPVPAPAVADTWRETLAQALASLGLEESARGVSFRLGAVEAEATAKATDPHASFEIALEGEPSPLAFTVCGEIDVMVAPAVQKAAGAAAAPAFVPATPPAAKSHDPAPAPDRLDAILDIELPLVVRFGRTELPLKTLTHLGPGSLIDLGRSADDPVDLLVSNRVVARGEVVVVGGNYGVRVLDVVSPRERARSMEA